MGFFCRSVYVCHILAFTKSHVFSIICFNLLIIIVIYLLMSIITSYATLEFHIRDKFCTSYFSLTMPMQLFTLLLSMEYCCNNFWNIILFVGAVV